MDELKKVNEIDEGGTNTLGENQSLGETKAVMKTPDLATVLGLDKYFDERKALTDPSNVPVEVLEKFADVEGFCKRKAEEREDAKIFLAKLWGVHEWSIDTAYSRSKKSKDVNNNSRNIGRRGG